MELKFNESTNQRPQGDRLMDGPLVTVDLLTFIEQIRKEEKWNTSDRNAITVFKSFLTSIVLIALRKGAEMKKHTAAGAICIQILEGKMLFKTNEQTVELGKGQMLVLHEGIPHSVLATEETVFLLTVTSSGAK